MIHVSRQDSIVVEHDDRTGERTTYHCATPRVAQIRAAICELMAEGWTVRGVSTTDDNRRPLLLPGEKTFQLVDGSKSDQRAQGFIAWRKSTQIGPFSDRAAADCIRVDACAGLPLLVTLDRGDTEGARRIIEWHLNS